MAELSADEKKEFRELWDKFVKSIDLATPKPPCEHKHVLMLGRQDVWGQCFHCLKLIHTPSFKEKNATRK